MWEISNGSRFTIDENVIKQGPCYSLWNVFFLNEKINYFENQLIVRIAMCVTLALYLITIAFIYFSGWLFLWVDHKISSMVNSKSKQYSKTQIKTDYSHSGKLNLIADNGINKYTGWAHSRCLQYIAYGWHSDTNRADVSILSWCQTLTEIRHTDAFWNEKQLISTLPLLITVSSRF